jgi:putative transposase
MSFLKIEQDSEVRYRDELYVVTNIISASEVIVRCKRDGTKVVARILDLLPLDGGPTAGKRRDLGDFTEDEWAEAERRMAIIQPLLATDRSLQVVQMAASAAGLHASTLYRWLRMFDEAADIAVLAPKRRGRKLGAVRLSPEVDAVIAAVIESQYLSPKKTPISQVIEDVLRKCAAAKITPPHPNTIRNRIDQLAPATVLRRRGRKDKARDLYSPILASFPGGTHPLAVVQIDHTPCDVIVVDAIHRKPLGRPWLTLAIDIYSRMIVGYYLSLEHPNANAVGLCLSMAILPKAEVLRTLGIQGDWPVWGVMKVVHCDNAKEFRGKTLARACAMYSIDLHLRPVRVPHYGGHIERMMGTVAKEMKLLPGATFSNPAERKGYNSDQQAAMTLAEFERYLIEHIVNVYHQRLHKRLDMSPLRKWNLGIVGDGVTPALGLPAVPLDIERLRLDFLPLYEKTVQRYGIQMDYLQYYDPCLDPFINAVDPTNPNRKRQFLVRRDPRDISRVYFFDPVAGIYLAIPTRELGLPAISQHEYAEIRRRLLAEGVENIDEALIAKTLEKLRAAIDSATATSKAARRKHEVTQTNARRATPTPLSTRQPASHSSPMPTVRISDTAQHDIFADEIEPFTQSRETPE